MPLVPIVPGWYYVLANTGVSSIDQYPVLANTGVSVPVEYYHHTPKLFSAPSARLIPISLCVDQKVVVGGSAEGAKKFWQWVVNYLNFVGVL